MAEESPTGVGGVIETPDGVQHEGVLPADAALPAGAAPVGSLLEGWYRSPGGVLAHADGPSQLRAYVDRGYVEVDEADALAEIGDGIELTVDRRDSKGTFDDAAVAKAVDEEGSAARSAAARKGAETKRRKKAEADAAARAAANSESDAVGAGD